MQNAPSPPALGVIPLHHKRAPSETLDDDIIQCISSYDAACHEQVQVLKAKLLALDAAVWTEEYHARHNVVISRPFHDKLGVNKLICVFSDTALENVYKLPFYNKFQNELVEIFRAIGISESQVVRCLFARLPPSSDIPAHHDNGSWVSKTHRIHIPILTNQNVIFKSGTLLNSMTRFAFNEADVIELNNAAKHSVSNADGSLFRIHLILDYVEKSFTDFPKYLELQAGSVVRQIRGRIYTKEDVVDTCINTDMANQTLATVCKVINDSKIEAAVKEHCRHLFIEQISVAEFVSEIQKLDLKKELESQIFEMYRLVDPILHSDLIKCLTKLKTFMIIGVQKCGTTSMYDYISQHPQVFRNNRREPHFFDWKYEYALHKVTLSEAQSAAAASILAHHTNANNTSSVMMQKYLYSLQLDLPLVAKALCSNDVHLLGESTPSYLLYGIPVAKRIREMFPEVKLLVILRDPVSRAYSHYNMVHSRGLEDRSFEEVVTQDLRSLKNVSDASSFQLHYANYLPTGHGSHSYVGRGLYAYQIENFLSVFPREQMRILTLEDDLEPSTTLHSTMTNVYKFLEIGEHSLTDVSKKNTRSYSSPIPEKPKELLTQYYACHNRKLEELLNKPKGSMWF